MVFQPYLAMTAAEMAKREVFPFPAAWMACHFSPYGTGLSNLPTALPEGSMLMLNDRMPIAGHDPERIAGELEETANALHCAKILLDFQRPGNPETAQVVQAVEKLPFPVGVSDCYAAESDCAVLLPPLPLTGLPEDYIAPWKGRELWLEVAVEAQCVTVTENGSLFSPCEAAPPLPMVDERLHCRYGIEVLPQSVQFTLQRSPGELQALMAACGRLGVSCFVGLYQQLGSFFDQAEAQDTALDQF